MYINGASLPRPPLDTSGWPKSGTGNWEELYFLLSLLAVGCFAFLWCGILIAIRYSYSHMYKPIKTPLRSYPGISVLKPLSGGGNRLLRNLETFFQLHYPQFELLLCVHNASDPAIAIVETLIQRYPQVDAKLFIHDGQNRKAIYCNPKIENLLPGYNAAKYDLVLISDCSVKADNETLVDLVNEYTAEENVGIVWQVPVICSQIRKTIGVATNQLFFATILTKSSLWWSYMGFPVALGSSTLIRREALDACGGLGAFGKYLAEDYFISREIYKRGWKIRLGSRPALHNPSTIPDLTLMNLYARVLRWKRLRQMMIPLVELAAPFTECLLMGIVGTWALNFLFGANIWVTMATHMLLFFTLDLVLLRRLLQRRTIVSLQQLLIGWIIIQVATPLIHVFGTFSREVSWRGNRYRLLFGGKVLAVAENSDSQVPVETPSEMEEGITKWLPATVLLERSHG